MFTKILFPTDGSEHSKKTFDYVKALAKTYECQVVVFHSYNVPILYTIEYNDRLKEGGISLLSETEAEFKNLGINVKTVLAEGYAGELIMALAERDSCDLIVMGTHGLSGVETFLVGSTSNYVVHHAKCPVLLIN
jgi:nucleotide-binding universal stress UspA family protein